MHLFHNHLTFARDAIGSCLYATRMDPTPASGHTAVPALCVVSAPSLSQNVVFWRFTCPPFTTPTSSTDIV